MCLKLLPILIALQVLSTNSSAQQVYPNRTVKVFLDCDVCPEQFIIQNTSFVDFVRDRQVADVHLIIVRQFLGGGGREYLLNFSSIGEKHDIDFEFAIQTYAADTRIEIK